MSFIRNIFYGILAIFWVGVVESIRFILIMMMLVFSVPPLAFSLPQDYKVMHGQVDFEKNGKNLKIRSSDNAIIQYNSFNIDLGETVRFYQNSSSSRVLNHVTGPQASQILGNLFANGQVYLLNSSGIFFGNQAVVDLNALYAVSGKMNYNDFLNHIDRFDSLSNAVINEGMIHANLVYLFGERVANQGSIFVEDGTISMAAGKKVLIGEKGGNFFIEVDPQVQEVASKDTGVLQAGVLDAPNGDVYLGTRDLFYAVSVAQEGSIKAKNIHIDAEHGKVNISGKMDVSNALDKGGHIEIEANEIALNGATLNADGHLGGGSIHIGGEFQGKGQLRTSKSTFIDKDSVISANAIQEGQGGRVIVWSDDTTMFEGKIEAKGGQTLGDGGFVEVSGKKNLGFHGLVDTSALNGKKGQLLLDPEFINVIKEQTGPDDAQINDNAVAALDEPSQQLQSQMPASNLEEGSRFFISSKKLMDQLLLADVELAASKDITIGDVIGVDQGSSSLTLTAGRDIFLKQDIALKGELTLDAEGLVSLGAKVDVVADININAASLMVENVMPQGSGTMGFYEPMAAFLKSHEGDVTITGLDEGMASPGSLEIEANGMVSVSGTGSTELHNLQIRAGSGIDLNHDFTLTERFNMAELATQEGNISLSGDFKKLGGILDIRAGQSLSESNDKYIQSSAMIEAEEINISADDVEISGPSSMMAHRVAFMANPTGLEEGQTRDIALGSADGTNKFALSTAELASIQAPELIIGGEKVGNIHASNLNLTQAGHEHMSLEANEGGITIDGTSSVFLGDLMLRAKQAINLSTALSVEQFFEASSEGDIAIAAGANINLNGEGAHLQADEKRESMGDFTMGSGSVLNANGHFVYIRANDVDIQGDIVAGEETELGFETLNGKELVISDDTPETDTMHFSKQEMDHIDASGRLVFGGEETAKITVGSDSGLLDLTGISAIVELRALYEDYESTQGSENPDSSITFKKGVSFGNRVELFSKGDILLEDNVSVNGGVLAGFDADIDGKGELKKGEFDFLLSQGNEVESFGDFSSFQEGIEGYEGMIGDIQDGVDDALDQFTDFFNGFGRFIDTGINKAFRNEKKQVFYDKIGDLEQNASGAILAIGQGNNASFNQYYQAAKNDVKKLEAELKKQEKQVVKFQKLLQNDQATQAQVKQQQKLVQTIKKSLLKSREIVGELGFFDEQLDALEDNQKKLEEERENYEIAQLDSLLDILDPETFANLKPHQIQAISPEDLAAIDVDVFAAIPPELLAHLKPEQVAALTPEQFEVLGTNQFGALGSTHIKALGVEALDSLDEDFVLENYEFLDKDVQKAFREEHFDSMQEYFTQELETHQEKLDQHIDGTEAVFNDFSQQIQNKKKLLGKNVISIGNNVKQQADFILDSAGNLDFNNTVNQKMRAIETEVQRLETAVQALKTKANNPEAKKRYRTSLALLNEAKDLRDEMRQMVGTFEKTADRQEFLQEGEVGETENLLEALSGEELYASDLEALADLDKDVIKKIDAEFFDDLNPEAFTHFSKDHFEAFSKDQVKKLTADQLEAIANLDAESGPAAGEELIAKLFDSLDGTQRAALDVNVLDKVEEVYQNEYLASQELIASKKQEAVSHFNGFEDRLNANQVKRFQNKAFYKQGNELKKQAKTIFDAVVSDDYEKIDTAMGAFDQNYSKLEAQVSRLKKVSKNGGVQQQQYKAAKSLLDNVDELVDGLKAIAGVSDEVLEKERFIEETQAAEVEGFVDNLLGENFDAETHASRLESFSEKQIKAIDPDKVDQLAPEVFEHFKVDQFKALSKDQVKKLTADQLEVIENLDAESGPAEGGELILELFDELDTNQHALLNDGTREYIETAYQEQYASAEAKIDEKRQQAEGFLSDFDQKLDSNKQFAKRNFYVQGTELKKQAKAIFEHVINDEFDNIDEAMADFDSKYSALENEISRLAQVKSRGATQKKFYQAAKELKNSVDDLVGGLKGIVGYVEELDGDKGHIEDIQIADMRKGIEALGTFDPEDADHVDFIEGLQEHQIQQLNSDEVDTFFEHLTSEQKAELDPEQLNALSKEQLRSMEDATLLKVFDKLDKKQKFSLDQESLGYISEQRAQNNTYEQLENTFSNEYTQVSKRQGKLNRVLNQANASTKSKGFFKQAKKINQLIDTSSVGQEGSKIDEALGFDIQEAEANLSKLDRVAALIKQMKTAVYKEKQRLKQANTAAERRQQQQVVKDAQALVSNVNKLFDELKAAKEAQESYDPLRFAEDEAGEIHSFIEAKGDEWIDSADWEGFESQHSDSNGLWFENGIPSE